MLSGDLHHLKDAGHKLLEEYKELARVGSARAYKDLETRLRGKTPHFGQMHSKQEIVLACGMLKKMIASLKYKKQRELEIQNLRKEESPACV